MSNKIIYALDFDGVICDSAVETGITGWKAAIVIWDDMLGRLPATELVDKFREVRPVLEIGYEAILVMRLLYQGHDAQAICTQYWDKTHKALIESGKNADFLKQLFGETRDRWIKQDQQEWIAMNPLFSGVTEKLQRLNQSADWYIVTTKQERFVSQILNANGITIDNDRIFGLDKNLNKAQVLTLLLDQHRHCKITFIEDRLLTLLDILAVKQLASIKLMLADWGYNRAQDISTAKKQRIKVIAIEHFLDL